MKSNGPYSLSTETDTEKTRKKRNAFPSFVEAIPSEEELRKRLEACGQELEIAAGKQKGVEDKISAEKAIEKENQTGYDHLANSYGFNDERRAFSDAVREAQSNIACFEEELSWYKRDQLTLAKEMSEIKSDLENTPLSQTKRKLFEMFDKYNEKAADLAEVIKGIRTLEVEFRNLGGRYEFVTDHLPTRRPVGPFVVIPKMFPKRVGGEESCWLFMPGCGVDFCVAPVKQK
jgi:chromosome segregation ATPase